MATSGRISPQEWAEMVHAGNKLLAQTACERSTITYGDFAALASRGRLVARSPLLMRLVELAAEPLDEAHGIHAASLVVRADSGRPGEGYFTWAARSGFDMTDPRAMWLAEVHRVWNALGPKREDLPR